MQYISTQRFLRVILSFERLREFYGEGGGWVQVINIAIRNAIPLEFSLTCRDLFLLHCFIYFHRQYWETITRLLVYLRYVMSRPYRRCAKYFLKLKYPIGDWMPPPYLSTVQTFQTLDILIIFFNLANLIAQFYITF